MPDAPDAVRSPWKLDNRYRLLIWGVIALIILGILYQAVNIGSHIPFHDWDESIYGQVTREFVRHPQLTLTYNGAPWFEKPPLIAWYYAAAWLLPFAPEITARVLSAILGCLSALLLYQLSTKIFRSRLAPITVIMVYVQSPIFLDRSLLVNADMMLTIGWLLYLTGVLSISRTLQLTGMMAGVLAKSLLGFVPLTTHGVSLLFTRKMNTRQVVWFLAMTVAGLLWIVLMTMSYGRSFINEHLYDHLFARVLRPIELHFGGKMFYPTILLQDSGLLAILGGLGLLGGVIQSTLRGTKGERGRQLVIYATPIIYFALLTLSKAKLHWYVTPLIPFIALGVGVIIEFLSHRIHRVRVAGVVVAIIIIFSVWRFVSSVSHIPSGWTVPTAKTRIAQCVHSQLESDPTDQRIAYLVPFQQRQDAQVIEAARLQIGSSFRYGSNPALIYYLDRPVDLFYRIDAFANAIADAKNGKYTAFILQEHDLLLPTVSSQLRSIHSAGYSEGCMVEDMVGYIRRY